VSGLAKHTALPRQPQQKPSQSPVRLLLVIRTPKRAGQNTTLHSHPALCRSRSSRHPGEQYRLSTSTRKDHVRGRGRQQPENSPTTPGVVQAQHVRREANAVLSGPVSPQRPERGSGIRERCRRALRHRPNGWCAPSWAGNTAMFLDSGQPVLFVLSGDSDRLTSPSSFGSSGATLPKA
jgi:hypothetical protein